jgi:hypothetical protein
VFLVMSSSVVGDYIGNVFHNFIEWGYEFKEREFTELDLLITILA